MTLKQRAPERSLPAELMRVVLSLKCVLCAVLSILILLLQACDTSPSVPESREPIPVTNWMQTFGANQAGFHKAELPTWPDGFSPRQQTQAESFVVQAILFGDNPAASDSARYAAGLTAQLDRLALRARRSPSPGQSAWRYDGVVRSGVSIDSAAEDSLANVPHELSGAPLPDLFARLANLSRDDRVARMAIDLGGVSEDALWVGYDRVALHRRDSPSGMASAKCQREYRWTTALSIVQSIEMTVVFRDCPDVQIIGPFARWQQFSNVVSAVITSEDHQGQVSVEPMRGFAWLSHSWGSVPNPPGAVLIDDVKLRLDDKQWLTVSRSKRRSGRGPQTVIAEIHENGFPGKQIDLGWTDGPETLFSHSGAVYPEIISLQSADGTVDIKLRVMNRLLESDDIAGRGLRVPVFFTGSHKGYGFLSFYALTTEP